jgi:hypothetical protein
MLAHPFDLEGRRPCPPVTGPTWQELLPLALLACIMLAAGVQLADRKAGFWEYGAGDTPTYVEITTAIRTWDFSGLREVKHLWGVAYLASAVAWLFGLPDLTALLVVSMCGSIASILLVRRLWGGWVAGFFAIISWDWLQASVLGGSETVFTALALAAFLAARDERWLLAGFIAACSATVRPVGAIVWAAVAMVLFGRGDLRRALIVMLVGAAVIGLYMLPLSIVRGDVLAHVHGYERDWNRGWPFGVPFAALERGMLAAKTPFAFARPAVWVTFIVTGSVAMLWRKGIRVYGRLHPVEFTFAGLYLLFLFSYSARPWGWSEFPRFAIPVIPFALFALEPWLPKDRRVLWLLSPTSGLLAAGWLIGFHRAWSLLIAPV